jgi:hypothetical protein
MTVGYCSGAAMLAVLAALAACTTPPAPAGPAEAACRRAARAQGLVVLGAEIAGPIPAAGLGGAERTVGARVSLATPAGPRLCTWTSGSGTAVIAPG